MANEGYDKDLDITRLVTDIENELAANALKSQDPVVQRTIKMCVFHIILKAISLSKDPKADKRAILSLYDSAKEIIINSTLDEDETTQNRLQDLVNSMIDGDDISAQLRSYTTTSRQWLDSKIMYLEAKLANISSQTNSIHDILKSMDSKSTSGSFKRFPGVVVVLITGFLAMLFTIMTSVVIISFLLTSAINNEGLSMEQQHQLLQHDSK